MEANSSIAARNRNPQVLALEVTRAWLDREGGQQRNARAARLLIEKTLPALERGDPAPDVDLPTLRELLVREDKREGASTLRGVEVETWWRARQEQLREACRVSACAWMPHLVVKTGGGRGLPTTFQLEVRPIEDAAPELSLEDSSTPPHGLRYRIDAVKPALWFRLLLGSRPFPVRSWRGYVLFGLMALNFILVGLIWLGLFWSWSQSKAPFSAADAALAGGAFFVSWSLWLINRPILLLPQRRVTIAEPWMLAWSELSGQLRTMRDSDRKLASRELSLVRHWGVCPLCSGEVDLADGEPAFPGRVVGRCNDAPTEHVFSFDPVRLVGQPLLASMAATTKPG
jgi:hypothetical protein